MLKLNPAKSILLICLIFLAPFPFHHLGGPFDPNAVTGWSALGFIVLASLYRSELNSLPKDSGLLVFAALSILALAVFHGWSGLAILPALLLLFFLIAAVSLNNCIDSGRLSQDFIEKCLLASACLLCLLTWPSTNYLDLDLSVVVGYLYFPIDEGGFRQRNNFASFLVSVLAFSFWYATQNRPNTSGFCLRNYRVWIWFVLALTVFLSGSRVGVLSLVLIGLLFPLMTLRSNLKLSVAMFAVISVAGLLGTMIDVGQETAGNVVLLSKSNESIAIRIGLYKAAWLVGLNESWTGFGWYQWQNLYPDSYHRGQISISELPYQGSILHPHNEVLQWWIVGGLAGVLFVIVPVVIYAVRRCIVDGNVSFLRMLVFSPIAIHSMTGFPLYASGFHWVFLALTCAVFASTQNLPSVKLPRPLFRRVMKGLSALSSAAAILLSIDISLASFKGWLLQPVYSRKISSEEYIRYRANDAVLTHWAHKNLQGHEWTRDLFLIALYEQNSKLVEALLPKMKAATQFRNDKRSWTLLASGYAGTGRRAELIGFLDYVEILDPGFARELREFYGLKK